MGRPMGRQIVDTNLSTRNARRELKRRSKPYWRLIEHGRHIGYRRSPEGGTWVARIYLGDGKYAEGRIGTADDITDADGVKTLSWAQAQRKTHSWFVQRQREAEGLHPNPDHRFTVADAIDEYLAWYRVHRKSYPDTKAYADAHILPALGKIEVSKLTPPRVRKWHEALATTPPRRRTKLGHPQKFGPEPRDEENQRSRKATANRVLTILKAALNKARAEGRVTDNTAWANVGRFKGVDAARLRFLDHNEARRLINAADPVFRPLVQAALLSGARYGELCNLRVADFKNGKLLIATSKVGKPRWIMLNLEGRQFFEGLVAGRQQQEPIFLKNGNPWRKSHQNDFMRQACAHAALEPMGFHQLRHSYASMAVMSGMPLLVLAENLGHSDTRMIEKHYGHLSPSFKDQMIEEHAPKFGIAPDEKIERIELRRDVV